MSEDAASLLAQGQALLKEGKRAEAADVLKRAVELDSENIAVWMTLAQAVESRNEQRIALTTVLQLDPGNEEAQQMLDALEHAGKPPSAAAEWRPGISQREFRLAVIGLALFTLAMFGIAGAVYGARASAVDSERRAATAVALEATGLAVTATERAFLAETQAVQATETALALNTPTPTATITPARVLPTAIPPTNTPTPTPDLLQLFPPPPANLGGRLIAIGGFIGRASDFLPVQIYPAGGGRPSELNADLAQSPTADDAFRRIAYARSAPDGVTIPVVDTALPDRLQGIDLLNAALRVDPSARDPRSPRMSRDGRRVVFNVLIQDRRVLFLFALPDGSVNGAPLTPIQRITPDDGADYFAADISPDGMRVVAVRQAGAGTDLVLIDLDPATNFRQFPLTNDSNLLVEDAPAFSPDGAQVAFSARASGQPSAIYIAVLQNDAFTSVTPLIQLEADAYGPVFSPNGQHVAFTSTLTGVPNIFLFDLRTRETFQRTSEQFSVTVSGWTN
jgi:tetratricopeptide (TPR) repeat protein